MLELVLSSLAGLAVAAAIKKIPRRESGTGELAIERDILTKTIERVHSSGLPQSKRSILLSRYQEQLESITSRIEGGESGYADPRLHSLLERMNQSISSMSKRLDDISRPAAQEMMQNAGAVIQQRPEADAVIQPRAEAQDIQHAQRKKHPDGIKPKAGQSSPPKTELAKAGGKLARDAPAAQNSQSKIKKAPDAKAPKKTRQSADEISQRVPGSKKQEVGGPLPGPIVSDASRKKSGAEMLKKPKQAADEVSQKPSGAMSEKSKKQEVGGPLPRPAVPVASRKKSGAEMLKKPQAADEVSRKPSGGTSEKFKNRQRTEGPLPNPAAVPDASSDPDAGIPEDDKLEEVVREISAKLAELKKIEAE